VASGNVLTLEEVVLQAAMLHVLVDEEPVLVLAAVSDQLHQVGMPQLPQEDHLRLCTHKTTSGPAIIHVHLLIVFSAGAGLPNTTNYPEGTQEPSRRRSTTVFWLPPHSASPCAPRYLFFFEKT
jgi:hypothetical protein